MRRILTTLALAACHTTAFSEVHEIQQTGLSFIPDTVIASPGDTIRWVHGSGSHTVNHGDCAFEDNPLFSGPINNANPVLEWVIPDAVNGNIPFFCSVSSHCSTFGMSGEIIIVPRSGSTVHDVQQDGFTFSPEQISVQPGDTVRWSWSAGNHTVTSGDNNTCIADGQSFDVALDAGNDTVLWVVPEDMPNSIEYFCRFHCELGHIGNIQLAVFGDLNGDGCINGADLTLLLSDWGAADSVADLNDDNVVDGADLTALLGNWSGCP